MAAGRKSMAKPPKSNGDGEPNKRDSSTQPVAEPDELLAYWDRAFAAGGYFRMIVRVTGREDNTLRFKIIQGPEEKTGRGGAPFSVNLDDGEEAWGSLPSTAQLVDPESSQRVGYLFVTKKWLGRQQGVVLAGGGKWPIKTSL